MAKFPRIVSESSDNKGVIDLPDGGWIERDINSYQYFNAAGKFHREGGPSFYDYDDKIEIWEQNGKYHRVDGPSYIDHKMGVEKWNLNGQLHREGGPAVSSDSMKAWYFHGKLHRTDGPALIRLQTVEDVQYWVNGKRLSEKEFLKHFSISGIP